MGSLRPEDFDRVARTTLFRDLSRETLSRLLQGGLLQRYPPETDLFEQGERPDFVHVLMEGAVQLFGVGQDKREAVVEILTPGEIFILAAALTDAPYLMSARVVTAARILLIPAPTLRKEIVNDGQLALTMMASLAKQFRRTVRQIKDLKLRTSTQRLGCFLLQFGQGEKRRITLPCDKRLIAARLGMTPETLSRAFSALRPLGVRVEGTTVILEDAPALEQACVPDRLIDCMEAEHSFR